MATQELCGMDDLAGDIRDDLESFRIQYPFDDDAPCLQLNRVFSTDLMSDLGALRPTITL